MKNVCDLEKKLVSNGYKVEIASYGSGEKYDVHGNEMPACYRDCVVVRFRFCDGAENEMEKENDFLRMIKRYKDFTIYDKGQIFRGYQYIITDKESAAELYADAKVKKMVLDEFWKARHEAYLKAVSA